MKGKRFRANSKNRRKIYSFLIIIFTIIIIYNMYAIIKWKIDKINNEKEKMYINEVAQVIEIDDTDNTEFINPPDDKDNDYWNYIKLPLIDVNISALKNINSDTVGFISVSGTNINYPVVQTTDNNYYLDNSFKRQKNNAGWIFMDYRNDTNNLSRNTIIYGHSRIDTTMFGTLKNILKTDWINNKNNYVVNLSTLNENTLWRVFSVYTIPEETYYIKVNFNNNKEYEDWLQKMLIRSEYNFNTGVNTKDKVLTLSTCYRNNARVVMHCKLIKRDVKK